MLSQADDLFKDPKIAAMVLEPIMAEGGDKSASDRFYNLLRNVAKANGVAFIVDEVQTGCMSTGK